MSLVGVKVMHVNVSETGASALGVFLRDYGLHKPGNEFGGIFDQIEDGRTAQTLLDQKKVVVALFNPDRGAIASLSDASNWGPELASVSCNI